MSWIEKLYKTYDNNLAHVGDQNDNIPLLPVCHTTRKAHVNVVIDGYGNFRRASVVPKAESRTIIPATEESDGRTSGYAPHPLCDKLQYVAGDYALYGGKKASQFEKYCELLEAWCSSQYSHPKVCAVHTYIRKGQLVQDLVNGKVFYIDSEGSLLNNWQGKINETPEIFKVTKGGGGQLESFVSFSVEVPGDPCSDLSKDETVWASWQTYYGNMNSAKGICHVTGGETILAGQHPAKIRNDGDKAKLLSSNDNYGFTFRGRFTTPGEACGVGFETTQKAHNALRWLIARQGRQDEDQAIVAWAVSGVDIPDLLADTASLLVNANMQPLTTITADTAQDIAIQFLKLIAGYSAKLGPTDDVIVIGLDSATKGRMAITFCRELTGSELLERLHAWHEKCCWLQRFGRGKIFIGAPAPHDIAQAAYGKSLDANKILRKATVERLLPCILDSAPIPRDLVESCVRRASNRNGIESWEWEKAIGIACALYRHHQKERRYAMTLERNRKTRDYLYGRLLALAERVEGLALNIGGENRETNAGRLMQRFADRPHSTWLTIETSLIPYKTRLRTRRPGFLRNAEKEIDEVVDSFTTTDFLSDHRLTGEFLLGYHCQRASLWAKPDDNTDEDAPAEKEQNTGEEEVI